MAKGKTQKSKQARSQSGWTRSARAALDGWVARHPRLAAGLYVLCFTVPSYFLVSPAIATSVNGFMIIGFFMVSESKRRSLWERSISFRLLELRRAIAAPVRRIATEQTNMRAAPPAPASQDIHPPLKAEKPAAQIKTQNYGDFVASTDEQTSHREAARMYLKNKTLAEKPAKNVAAPKAKQASEDVQRSAFTEEHYYSDSLIREFLQTAVNAKKIKVSHVPLARLTDDGIRMIKFNPELEAYTSRYLSAARFMPIAEKHSMQHKIASLVLQKAVQSIRNTPASEVAYAVDVYKDGLTDAHFMARLLDIARYSRSDFARLSFEMSYADFENASARSMQMMRNMAQLGGKFALTDVAELAPDLELLQKVGVKMLKFKAGYLQPMMEVTERFRQAMQARRVIEASGIRFVIDDIDSAEQLAAFQAFSPRHAQGALFKDKNFKDKLPKRKAA
jgi:EAL domain-containing protein (putative c-di-GMP-specific phosphodiesterase class I)